MSENDNEKCPYYGECGIVNNCNSYKDCRVKELFDDFYKVEKLYLDSKKENKKLNKQVEVFTRQLEKANKDVIKEQIKNAKDRKKLEKIEERIQDLDNYSENNVNVMNDILQIIQGKSENEKV